MIDLSTPWGSLIQNTVGKVVDKALAFIPDPAKQAEFMLQARQLDISELAQQVDIDKIEAASKDWFSANWRPFIGWICGAAFGYKFIAQPFLVLFILLFSPTFPSHALPVIDWTELSAVMFGMLGLSYHRTQEKTALINSK